MSTADNPLAAALQGQMAAFYDSFGALLICTCIGCMLFGLTTHQTYRYFRLYPSDGPALKSLVVVLLLLDILHTVTSIHVCYYYLVSKYFNPAALGAGVWSLRMVIIETGIVILVSHSFYARRLYLLGNRHLFPVILIAVLLVSEMAFSIAATVESFIQVTFENFYHFTWLNWGLLSSAVLVDVVATSILTYYLRRSRTGFKRTDSVVDIMMVYTINTGLSTSIITLAALISAIALPHTLVYAAITIVGTKMYANSLLAVLNSRRSLIDKGVEGFETGSFGLQVYSPRLTAVREVPHVSPLDPCIQIPKKPNARNDTIIDIKVTNETYLDHDASDRGTVKRSDTSGSVTGS